MPVILKCRVCKREGVVASRLLSDVCESCLSKVQRLQRDSWEAEHAGQSGHGQESTNDGGQQAQEPNKAGTPGHRAGGPEAGIISGAFRAGDAVKKVTDFLGIVPCSSCQQRHRAMNTVDFSKPAATVLRGLIEAAAEPEKVLARHEEVNDRAEAKRTPGGAR